MSIRSLLLLGAVSVLAACSSINVSRTGGISNDLTSYQSYRWNLPPLNDPDKYAEDAVTLDVAMRREVGGHMTARGFTQKAHTEQAELIVDYRLQFIPETFAEDTPQDYGLIWQRSESGKVNMTQNRPMGDPNVMLERATLLLIIYNSDKSDILWEMSADRLLEQGRSTAQVNETIAKVVDRMYEAFPVGQPQK